jgi:hypothetical protein
MSGETKKKATDVEVGDVLLVGFSTLGSMSLRTGEFKRGGESGVREHLITRIERAEEDSWNEDVTVWGPTEYVVLFFTEHEGTKFEREKHVWYLLDDRVNVKSV